MNSHADRKHKIFLSDWFKKQRRSFECLHWQHVRVRASTDLSVVFWIEVSFQNHKIAIYYPSFARRICHDQITIDHSSDTSSAIIRTEILAVRPRWVDRLRLTWADNLWFMTIFSKLPEKHEKLLQISNRLFLSSTADNLRYESVECALASFEERRRVMGESVKMGDALPQWVLL